MKVSKWLVKDFESTQKQYGTKIAIENVFWLLAAEIMKNVGAIRIKTTYKKIESGLKRKG